jgi:cell wall-associated NlpC family hydrolase
LSSKKARDQFAKLAVIAVSGGLVATLALPANAFNQSASQEEATARAPKEMVVQTLAASSAIELAVSRDGYTATKHAVIPVLVNRFVTLNPPAQTYSGQAIVDFAMQFVGVVPYGSGNSPTTSFSCDGLTQYVFKNFGISLPRMVHAQAALGVPISAADAKPGDLLWYPGQHIGIFAGSGMMIDSPRPGQYVAYRPIWGNPIYLRLKVGK